MPRGRPKTSERRTAEPTGLEEGTELQSDKDKAFVEKAKTISVKTESRNKPALPPTVTVCGNVLKVDQSSGKVKGPSDPKEIRARRLDAARRKRLGGSSIMDVELPQVD